MMLALLVLLVFVVAVSIFAFIYMICLGSSNDRLQSKKGPEIPGPRGLPIIGSLLDFDVRFNHMSLAKWAKQYGGICKVKLGSETWVVPGKYDYVREALITKGRSLGGRNRTYRLQVS